MFKTFAGVGLVLALAGRLGLSAAEAQGGAVSGTFIQFNREVAARSVEQWRSDLAQMRRAGINTIVVQWVVDDSVAYFKSGIPRQEQMDGVERLFEAIGDDAVTVYLGLEHDPGYWTRITAREVALRDYFMIRISRNARVQQALLDAFGKRPQWRGYYIPDEIDDKTWRLPPQRDLMSRYVRRMTAVLKAADPQREVCISAFVRGRSAPALYARLMKDLVGASGVDHLLVQDGAGEADPPLRYLPVYYEALKAAWAGPGPDLWCVVEAFRRIDGGESFKAEPAAPERVKDQLAAARVLGGKVLLFTFGDYADPDGGAKSAALYKALVP